MARTPLTIDEALSLLTATPGRIATLAEGLTAGQLRTAPEHDLWSANDLLAHLRSCADVWGNCITTILAEDEPTIRAIDPRTWMKQTDYPDLAFHPSLETYTSQRTTLLATLNALSPDEWSRTATVTGAGKPLTRTTQFYASWMARHERSHYRQLQRIIDAVR